MSGGFGRGVMLWKLSSSVTLACGKQTPASLQIKAACKILCPAEVSETFGGKALRAQCSGRLPGLYLAQPDNR